MRKFCMKSERKVKVNIFYFVTVHWTLFTVDQVCWFISTPPPPFRWLVLLIWATNNTSGEGGLCQGLQKISLIFLIYVCTYIIYIYHICAVFFLWTVYCRFSIAVSLSAIKRYNSAAALIKTSRTQEQITNDSRLSYFLLLLIERS